MLTISQILNIIGLCFDIIGVLMLFKYGLPSDVNKEGHSFMLREEDDEAEKLKWKKHDFISKIALAIIILGFLFQVIATATSGNGKC